MTDAELIALIQETDPADLTPEQCALLVAAARRSPEILRECQARVELEQRLAHVVGRPDLPVERILARARFGRGRALRMGLWLGLALGLLVALVVAGRTLRGPVEVAARPAEPALVDGPAAPPPEVAPAPPEAASEPEPPKPPAEPSPPATPAPPPVAVAPPPVPAPPPAAPVEPVPEPWEADLAAADADAPPAALLFGVLDSSLPPLSLGDLKRWFEALPGKPSTFGMRPGQQGPCAGMSGVHRLLAPLAEGTALRMVVPDWKDVRIHARSGAHGVTLDAYGPAGPWAAYAGGSDESQLLPRDPVLVARDEGRMEATNPQPATQPTLLDLRYAGGLLTLSRGDVRVIDVPLAGAPTELVFEGLVAFRDLRMIPAAPLPAPATRIADQAGAAVELGGDPAAWRTKLEAGSSFAPLADGGVQLVAEKNADFALALLPLPPGPPREIVVRIDGCQAGTGLVLADAAGTPQRTVAFLANQQNKTRLRAQLQNHGERALEAPGTIDERPLSLVGEQVWVKLVHCAGLLRGWTSVDGIHWAAIDDPLAGCPSVAMLGLSAVPHPSRRTITLGAVRAIPFAALAALAPADVAPPTGALPPGLAPPAWREAALKLTPAGSEPNAWLRGCALRTLGGDCTPELALDLLELLWRERLARDTDPAGLLATLGEIATVAPVWKQPGAYRVTAMYEQAGLALADRNVPRAYSLVAPALQGGPLAAAQMPPILPRWLARDEVLKLAISGRWAELDEVIRRVDFFGLLTIAGGQPEAPLFAWAGEAARDRLAGLEPSPPVGGVPQAKRPKGKQPRGKISADWQHPVVIQLGKEGTTLAADLRGAVEENDYRHACEVIVSLGAADDPGLIGDGRDPALSTSIAGVVADALRTHPPLLETMRGQFAGRAQLRLRQAIDTADIAALKGICGQYPGTEGAAEAALLLGDREVATGNFLAALGRYREAKVGLPATLRDRLAVAEQLAGAFLGRPATPTPPGGPVTIGGVTLDPAGWQQLCEDVRRAALVGAGGPVVGGPPTALARLPAARPYEPTVRARLEGDVGENPAAVPAEFQPGGPAGLSRPIDWVAGQAALVVSGERLLVSNRFQLAAHDVRSGQVQWRAGVGAEAGPTHRFPCQTMRPVVTASHAYVRRLRKAGPQLAAVRLADGGVDWETLPPTEQRFMASDPLLMQDRLVACVATKNAEGHELSLASFRLSTGECTAERRLVQLRPAWLDESADCQLMASDEGLLVAVAGGVVCCDGDGSVRWVRRDPWVPIAVDALWRLQPQVPPLVIGDRLVLGQPAVPGIVAIEMESGRGAWAQGFAGLRRVLGTTRADGRTLVVAERLGGLVAVDAADGTIAWHVDEPDLLDACLVGMEDGVLLARLEPVPAENVRQPVLVWLDGGSGAVRRTEPLASLKDPQPRLGPLVTVGDRVWGLFGRGSDPQRDLVEMTPK